MIVPFKIGCGVISVRTWGCLPGLIGIGDSWSENRCVGDGGGVCFIGDSTGGPSQ